MSRKPNLENRQRILRIAFDLMHKNGYKGVSMDEIAVAAGLKKANLFHYFPTKETLGLAVFDHAVACAQKAVDENLKRDGHDPIAAVETLFEQATGTMKESGCAGGCFIGNLAQELSDCNECLRQKIADHMQRWSGQWAEYLRSKKENGYFRSELDPQTSAVGLLSLFEGAMIFCKASRSTSALESAKQVARQHFESFRL